MSLPLTFSFFDSAAAPYTASAAALLRQRSEPPPNVLFLDSGCVLLAVREAQQVRHQLGTVQGPTWLDAAFVLCNQPCPVDIVAQSQVRLRSVSRELFLHHIAELPLAVQGVMHSMAAGYCQQMQWAVSRLVQDAQARCAQWLLHHAKNDGSGALRVTLHQRKHIIAAQLGIAPETLSRVLRHLRQHGLITGSGNVLALPKPHALQLVAGG